MLVEKYPSPKFITLETTTRCNLQCIHCALSKENDQNLESGDLSLELFYKLLPMFQDLCPTIQLSGQGETLLHPNFMEMLEILSSIGCRVVFQTNGTLLTPQKIEKIVRKGVEAICISIDAATPDLFRKIRRGARLEKILENIQLINKMKKHLNTQKPKLEFEFVAMRQNIHELPKVVKLAGELGVIKVVIAELMEFNLTRGQSLVNDPLMGDWVSKAEAEAQKWGINLTLPSHIPGREISNSSTNATSIDFSNPTPYKNLRKTCKEPWERMFVRYDGKVIPCCVIVDPYGDLCTQSFEEIWFGSKYQGLRTALLSDHPFDVCVQCPFYGWETLPSNYSLKTTDIIEDETISIEGLTKNAKNGIIDEKEQYISYLESLIKQKEAALNHIYNSPGWKALDKIFPGYSKRRKIAMKLAKFVWNFLERI